MSKLISGGQHSATASSIQQEGSVFSHEQSSFDPANLSLQKELLDRIANIQTRIERNQWLLTQIDALDEQYVEKRLVADRAIMAPNTLQGIRMNLDGVMSIENRVNLQRGRFHDARSSLRRAIFIEIADHLDTVLAEARLSVAEKGMESICYLDLFVLLVEKNMANILRRIPNIYFTLINNTQTQRQIDTPRNFGSTKKPFKITPGPLTPISAHMIRLACCFPALERQRANIHDKAEIEAAMGHLFSCLTGINHRLYDAYEAKRAPWIEEYRSSAPGESSLPPLARLNGFSNQLHVYLMQKAFEGRLKLSSQQDSTDSTEAAEALLRHYQYFGKEEEDKNEIAEFEALPPHSVLTDWVRERLSRVTRKKVLAKKAEQVQSPWLMEKSYHVLILIQKMDALGRGKNPRIALLAKEYGNDLMAILYRSSTITKPADPAILESLFSDLTDLEQLVQYSYDEFRKA